jgi:prepilin-type N-terminal cleavage/methylation domain-containing protein
MALSRNGFTLLEVLVALGLFAIAVGSLPALLITTVRANVHASRITEATDLAQDKLETIRNTPYAAVTSGTDTLTVTGSTKVYVRSWVVTAGPTATTKKVAVTIGWTDQQSDHVELDTVIGG